MLLYPDYTKDVSEVYRDVTVSTLTRRCTLWSLAEVEHTSQTWNERGQLSSWVPRYDLVRQSTNISEVTEVTLRCKLAASVVRFDPARLSLKCKGFTVATVQHPSPVLGRWSEWKGWLRQIFVELAMRLHSSRSDPILAECPETAPGNLSTFGWNTDYFQLIYQILRQPLNADLNVLEEMFSNYEKSLKLRPRLDPDDKHNAHQHSLRMCMQRRVFCTTDSRVGLGPEMMQSGDIVAPFFSGPTPYVLRSRDDGRFDFVGQCSLRGLQADVAIAMLAQGRFEERTFELV